MDIFWLWLTALQGVGPVTQRSLVEALGSPQAIYNAGREELKTVHGLRAQIVETILNSRSLDMAKRTEALMRRHGVKLLSFVDLLYPQSVNKFSYQPAVIYYRGNLRPPQPSVGIVGSRRCTAYGKQVAAEAAVFLARNGVTVVSGMAKGIDSYAHTACLKEDGYTLAFAANGPDICYPPEQRSLMDEIIRTGAVLSPYPPGVRPRQEYFPARNRLLSAWVDQLLAVEAGERSGALTTARYAMEQNRRVFAVPNSIYSPESLGTNRLLQKGAEPYLEPKQLLSLEDRRPQQNPHEKAERNAVIQRSSAIRNSEARIDPRERQILQRLEKGDRNFGVSDLLDIANGNTGELLSLLCLMELEGKVAVSGQMVSLVV